MMNIPETVSATVALHLAQTRHELAHVVAELESLPVLTARGKTLRGKRDRLIPELDAWTYLMRQVGDQAERASQSLVELRDALKGDGSP